MTIVDSNKVISDVAESQMEGKLKLPALTALVISALVAAGVFSLPQNMAAKAGAGAILIGWGITFVGMLMLAFVFQTLAHRKSEVEGGVYGYARVGFGEYIGFNSAWGYWISAWIGNVSYYVVICSALGSFSALGFFGDGTTLPALIFGSILVWLLHFLICRGVQSAALLNLIGTVAKVVPLIMFIVLVAITFKIKTFNIEFWGNTQLGSVMDQVKNIMLVTTWVFIGIEGAAMYSGRAAKKSDVGKATMIGFFISILLFVAASVLSLGVLSQPELAQLKNPSTAGVLAVAVGPWGAALMNIGLIVSVGSALLAWTLLSAETAYMAGKDGTMPKFLGKENNKKAPVNALLLTTALTQLFLIIAHFSQAGYLALLLLATSMILIPYFLSGLYALKVAIQRDGYESHESNIITRDIIVGALATIYGAWLVYAAGMEYLLLSMILYALGIVFYVWARKEKGEKIFKPAEVILAILVVIAGIYAIYLLATGVLSLS